MSKERILAIVRIVALFVTAINALLAAKGINPIPFDETLVGETACYVVAGATALWAWWKNNNVTNAAIQKYSEESKQCPVHYDDEADFDDIHEVKESDVSE